MKRPAFPISPAVRSEAPPRATRFEHRTPEGWRTAMNFHAAEAARRAVIELMRQSSHTVGDLAIAIDETPHFVEPSGPYYWESGTLALTPIAVFFENPDHFDPWDLAARLVTVRDILREVLGVDVLRPDTAIGSKLSHALTADQAALTLDEVAGRITLGASRG